MDENRVFVIEQGGVYDSTGTGKLTRYSTLTLTLTPTPTLTLTRQADALLHGRPSNQTPTNPN